MKNIAQVAGRPSLAYAVDALREAVTPLQSVLLTENAQIAEVGRALGLDVLAEPAEFASDDGIDETKLLRFALESRETPEHQFRYVLLHYACVPIRPPGIVDRMVDFLKETGADFVQTASRIDSHAHPYRVVNRHSDGRMTDLFPGTADIMSQDYPSFFSRTAAEVGLRRETVMNSNGVTFFDQRRPLDRRCLIHEPDECVDLDEPRDITWAEFLLQQRNKKDV